MAQPLEIYLANPRGFCSGVTRAINLVEKALRDYGSPLFVHHEIVHNKHVVESLRAQGVVFVESLAEISDLTRPLIISAHGAAKNIYQQAQEMGLTVIDATCPLVAKVHQKITRLADENKNIIVIGKANHPEIVGTIGQLNHYPHYLIINKPQDVAETCFERQAPLGMVTQTTLSTTEVAEVMQALRDRFGDFEELSQSDTCYATTHRQAAIRELAPKVEVMIVVGSKNSSNSLQLQKIALSAGAKKAFLIDDATELPWADLEGIATLGLSAGASAPEVLIEDILATLKRHYENLNIHDNIMDRK